MSRLLRLSLHGSRGTATSALGKQLVPSCAFTNLAIPFPKVYYLGFGKGGCTEGVSLHTEHFLAVGAFYGCDV